MEQPVKKNKSRTAITIDPDLWQKAKDECTRRSLEDDKKFSFSSLVEEALEKLLGV